MTAAFWVLIVLLALGVIALASYFVRLQRKSREVAKTLDYDNMREWRDED